MSHAQSNAHYNHRSELSISYHPFPSSLFRTATDVTIPIQMLFSLGQDTRRIHFRSAIPLLLCISRIALINRSPENKHRPLGRANGTVSSFRALSRRSETYERSREIRTTSHPSGAKGEKGLRKRVVIANRGGHAASQSFVRCSLLLSPEKLPRFLGRKSSRNLSVLSFRLARTVVSFVALLYATFSI